MLYTLENENIKITANTFGGELNNLITKNDSTEFLWCGDKQHWKYHSPVLFPIVGKVINNTYRVDGKSYELPQHGLARLREFTLVNESEDKLSFELTYSEDTLKVYPYKFKLTLSYTLLENGVKVSYDVENLDDKDIYFSIGAHPAFMCPIKENETFEDYYFEFNKKENSSLMALDVNTGYFSGERIDFFKDSNKIPLSFDLFNLDALIFDDLKSNTVTLKSDKNSKELTMDFTGFPYLALWTKATGAPFVCIEPWYGHSDLFNFTGELKEKLGIEKLEIGKTFNASYRLFLK
ncbi:aldose 1-epimerase family protein [Clostridium sp.]|uniref:aldose 1-epimerase family protein n=1 Tax=Clostridium sp. TaxID=1506 RepID=UPI00261D1796|nr:aldose 1-epimerase family protein [Clostridium sp.]